MNYEIKNEIEDMNWHIQLLTRFATIGSLTQTDEDNFKKLASDMSDIMTRLESLLIFDFLDNMKT